MLSDAHCNSHYIWGRSPRGPEAGRNRAHCLLTSVSGPMQYKGQQAPTKKTRVQILAFLLLANLASDLISLDQKNGNDHPTAQV